MQDVFPCVVAARAAWWAGEERQREVHSFFLDCSTAHQERHLHQGTMRGISTLAAMLTVCRNRLGLTREISDNLIFSRLLPYKDLFLWLNKCPGFPEDV